MKKPGDTKCRVIVVERELIASRAFLTLTGAAPAVYLLFLCRRKVGKRYKGGGKHKAPDILNNGRITFTYREAQSRFGYTAPKFTRALTQLIEHGFLDVTHDGGGLEGDTTRYALSDRWQAYGTPAFKPAKRTKGRPWVVLNRGQRTKTFAPAHTKTCAAPAEARTKTCADSPVSAGKPRTKTCAFYRTRHAVPVVAGEKEGGRNPLPLSLPSDLRPAGGRPQASKSAAPASAEKVQGGSPFAAEKVQTGARDEAGGRTAAGAGGRRQAGESAAPAASADVDGVLVAMIEEARGRRLSAREAPSFLLAVQEARAAGATDALIAWHVRQAGAGGAPWNGPNAAKVNARALLDDFQRATGLDGDRRRKHVGKVLSDIRFAGDYLAKRIGGTDSEGRRHNEQVLRWAEKHRATLEAAGWTAAEGDIKGRPCAATG